MVILLWALCPLSTVEVTIGSVVRTCFVGPGNQLRDPVTFVYDSMCFACLILTMFFPLLHGWGPFALLANLYERYTGSIQPGTPARILETLLKPCQVARGDECIICHESFIEPAQLSCSHKFCDKCVRLTLSLNDHCPLCRQKPLPWNRPQGPTTGSYTPGVLRCVATYLDAILVLCLTKRIPRGLLDPHSMLTIKALAHAHFIFTGITQSFLLGFLTGEGPERFRARAMGFSGLPGDVVSFIEICLVVCGVLSSWGMRFEVLETGIVGRILSWVL